MLNDEQQQDRYFWPVMGLVAGTVLFLGVLLTSGQGRKQTVQPQQKAQPVQPQPAAVQAPQPAVVQPHYAVEAETEGTEAADEPAAVAVKPPTAPDGMFGNGSTGGASGSVASTPRAPIVVYPLAQKESAPTYTPRKTTSDTTAGTYGPRGPPALGGTAENGSYYGEVSEATGRPKTVYVRGYYRKDGTYVRGHYRSKK